MPQLSKGGKFVFGISILRSDFTVRIPPQTIEEYKITADDDIILFTGSKSTGGFCVTCRRLLETSKLKHILNECPVIGQDTAPPLEFVRYKGRGYCRAKINENGILQLTDVAAGYLGLEIGSELMVIRSSNIAFTMGAKGPLMDAVHAYQGKIDQF